MWAAGGALDPNLFFPPISKNRLTLHHPAPEELPSCRSQHTLEPDNQGVSGYVIIIGRCVAGLELKSAGSYLSRSRVEDP